MARHNVDPRQMHMAIIGRLQSGLQVPFLFDADEAYFIARMIEYVDASTDTINKVIDLIENDPAKGTGPTKNVQKAHSLLTELRGNPTP